MSKKVHDVINGKSAGLSVLKYLSVALGAVCLIAILVQFFVSLQYKSLFDLVHWSLSHVFSVTIGLYGLAITRQRSSSLYLMWAGLISYLVGELVYNFLAGAPQIASPNITDFFFLAMPLLTFVGFIIELCKRLESRRKILIALLDVFGVLIASFAIIVLTFFPNGIGNVRSTDILFALYPMFFLAASVASFMLYVHARRKSGGAEVLFTTIIVVQSTLWLVWNRALIDNSVTDGGLLNVLFSISEILYGLAFFNYIVRPDFKARIQYSRFFMRVLPILIIVLSLVPFFIAYNSSLERPKLLYLLLICVIVASVVSLLRQILSLTTRDHVAALLRDASLSAESFTRLYQFSKDCIFVLKADDGSFDIVECNESAANTFRRRDSESLKEFGGRMFRENFFNNPQNIVPLQTSFAEPGPSQFNLEVLIDGSLRPVHVTVVPHRLGGSEISLVYLIVRDMTEIESANQLLEKRVEERTVELIEKNTKLQQAITSYEMAKDELIRAEKFSALGSMVAGISHELNTPIGLSITLATSIEHQIEYKRDNPGGELNYPQLKESCDLLVKSLRRAAELISGFKQVAVDQTSSAMRNFDIKEVVQEILRLQRIITRFKKFVYECSSDESVELLSYPGALGQVLQNLIQNAVMHGFEGSDEGRIEITWEKSGNRLKLVISDNGVGMSPETMEQIFTPFYTTKRGQGGSGLGLAIVENLVHESLGGRIEVSSSKGEGTRFLIDIPLSAPK